jgi:hypothetical protein
MGGAAFDDTLAEPEEHPTVGAEPLEIWMDGRALPAVEVDRMKDTERRKCFLAESDRAADVAHRNEDVVEHIALLRVR